MFFFSCLSAVTFLSNLFLCFFLSLPCVCACASVFLVVCLFFFFVSSRRCDIRQAFGSTVAYWFGKSGPPVKGVLGTHRVPPPEAIAGLYLRLTPDRRLALMRLPDGESAADGHETEFGLVLEGGSGGGVVDAGVGGEAGEGGVIAEGDGVDGKRRCLFVCVVCVCVECVGGGGGGHVTTDVLCLLRRVLVREEFCVSAFVVVGDGWELGVLCPVISRPLHGAD